MEHELEHYFDRLWPICRSLTGNGNRETLKILSEVVSGLDIIEVPAGTACLDWTVPPEWNIRKAWIRDSKGTKVVDFDDNNLHIVGYSTPFSGVLSFEELKPHLHTLPAQPNDIPYLTSYYNRTWGFCLEHAKYQAMDENETYHIHIDSDLDASGSMTVAEAFLQGESSQEILISTYFCHPSMANNELSGPLVAAFVHRTLAQQTRRKYSYRFVFAPETIGAIYNLSKYGEHWQKNLVAGYVVTCAGDGGPLTYKKSRTGDSLADRAAAAVLQAIEPAADILEFFPFGSDERQYCSPGFNLPVGSLMRTMYGRYNEYHTSADNKSIMSFQAMQGTIEAYISILNLIEQNCTCINQSPYGEPMLGKRNLYASLGAQKEKDLLAKSVNWVLNLADGTNDTIDVVTKSGMPFMAVLEAIDKLRTAKILSSV